MEDLKQSLNKELWYVKEVWFDQHGNWYLHKVSSAVKKMTREQILEEAPKSPETVGKKKK